MSKPKTGDDLDNAAKHLNAKRRAEPAAQKPFYDCANCDELMEQLPSALNVVLHAVEHLGPDGIISLGYNELTGKKFKAVVKKEEISDYEFNKIKAEQDQKVKDGLYFRSSDEEGEDDEQP